MAGRTKELPPKTIGKYKVRAQLGAGGMAQVYLAYLEGPAGFSKPVAIKRMKRSIAAVDEFVDLFLTEAKTASLLAHPNICQVQELSGSDANGYFMVMEYLVGVPLTKLLAKQIIDQETFSVGLLVSLLCQACEGMHYAHTLQSPKGKSYQIVHRDLSPPNILLTVNGMAKILDFGISKSTQSVVKTATGQIRGKFSYMSPEQLRGHELDPRSDVFSLGTILYELLAGRRLFKRASRLETFQAITTTNIEPVRNLNPKVPEKISDILSVALAKNRADRFSSARALGTALSETMGEYEGNWTAPQIAEVVERVFERELQAHQRFLDAVESGTESKGEILQGLNDDERTLVEESAPVVFDPTEISDQGPTEDPAQ